MGPLGKALTTVTGPAALLAIGALAACGDAGQTASPTPAHTGASGHSTVSSRSLQACLTDFGGRGTRVQSKDTRFSGLPAHGAFGVSYPDGTNFSVAVEKTNDAAERLQTLTQGVLVATQLSTTSASDEAPAEMKDGAAATVHRIANVVILYDDPRHDDDAGVVQCLAEER